MDFKPLITNPWPNKTEISVAERSVVEYVEHVTQNRFCPFIRGITRANGYEIACFDDPPGALALDDIAAEVLDHFSKRPRREHPGFDPTTLITVFTHPDCLTENFGQAISGIRDRWRLAFLWQGFMISQMYPLHPDPTGKGEFRSPAPMIIVDRMHPSHRAFMRTPEAHAAFRHHFPEKK